ncbi:MAG: nuclear transport factor 2 family protein [Nitrospiria bacterium]
MMMTEIFALYFAKEWIEAWNSHNLKKILSHYSEKIEFSSPFIITLLGNSSGTIRGKKELKSYFEKGLSAYPDLHFKLIQVLSGVGSLTLYYESVKGMRAAEVMEINEKNKITFVKAHYSATAPSMESNMPHPKGNKIPALNHTPEKTTTVILFLRVENNSSFVRGKKRSIEDIEQYHLSEFGMKKLDESKYELVIPYEDDADLEETINRLLGDIEGRADLRNCFIEADVIEKGTERYW